METKICSKCKKELTLDNFYLRDKKKNKYRNKCKGCKKLYNSEYYKNHDKEIIEQHKQYYKENKPQIREQQNNYKKSNPKKIKEYKQEYVTSYSKYSKFSKRLKNIEIIRRDPDNLELLQVKCTYCGKWMNPTYSQAHLRSQTIRGIISGGNNFYCSDECKVLCPTFNKIEIPDDHKRITLEDGLTKIVPKDSNERNYRNEVNPEFRKFVFNLDNQTCLYCGESKYDNLKLELHCHHINPRKTHPHEECDPDNGITVCKECHKFIHSFKGCRYTDLANCNI